MVQKISKRFTFTKISVAILLGLSSLGVGQVLSQSTQSVKNSPISHISIVQAAKKKSKKHKKSKKSTSERVVNAKYRKLAVQLHFPKQQVQGNIPYYDLILKDGQKATIPIKITNNASKATIVKLTPVNTRTTDNYQVAYDAKEADPNTPKDTHTITDMLSAPLQIKLGNHESKVVQFNVTGKTVTPVALGGIKIQESGDTHGIIVAVNIANKSQSDTSLNGISNNFKLVSLKAVKEAYPYFNVQVLNQGGLVTNGTLKATLMYNGQPVGKMTKSNIQLAPNSTFNCKIPYNKKDALSAGNYNLIVTLTGEHNASLHKNITFSQTAVDSVNSKLGLKKHKSWLKITGIVALVLVGAGVIVKMSLKLKDSFDHRSTRNIDNF